MIFTSAEHDLSSNARTADRSGKLHATARQSPTDRRRCRKSGATRVVSANLSQSAVRELLQLTLVVGAFARLTAAGVVAAAIACGACASQQDTIQQQQEKLESLGASTQLIAEDWLAGQLSGTFTKTALEATFTQVEQQRAVLAARPQMLLDARGAALSQRAEALSRLIAQVIHDVDGADSDAVRRRLAAIPIVPGAR